MCPQVSEPHHNEFPSSPDGKLIAAFLRSTVVLIATVCALGLPQSGSTLADFAYLKLLQHEDAALHSACVYPSELTKTSAVPVLCRVVDRYVGAYDRSRSTI
jgi:hypothetical protein